MAGRSWLSLRNSTVALAVNVGMNLVLIPLAGIRGAAISWAVAIVVRNVLPLLQVRRHLGMWPVTPPAVQVGALAVVCFGVADVITLATGLPTVLDLAALALGTLAYLYGVWSRHDALGLDAFRAALRRRSVAGAQLAPEP
jgi:O-antigen/teichoic acid export membrane protein